MLKLLSGFLTLLTSSFVLLIGSAYAEPQSDEEKQETLIPLPATQLFDSLRADPKEPRFFISKLSVDSEANNNTSIAAVGFGEHFGFIRRQTEPQQGWQAGLSAAVFAQFNLDTPSDDLINADYIVGIPVTWRQGDWSGRTRIYHQSSHLGDEYLLHQSPQRINLSFESLEVMVARDFGSLRIYGGGENIFSHQPADLGKKIVHFGIDWNGREDAFRIGQVGAARWVAGVDAKRWEQNDWKLQLSVKAGLEFAPQHKSNMVNRRWSLLLEYYDGPSPYGQFYTNDVSYWGMSLQLGL